MNKKLMVAAVAVVLLGAMVYVWMQAESPANVPANTQDTTTQQQTLIVDHDVPVLSEEPFDIEAFYANVRNGLSMSEVPVLAGGKDGECAKTGYIDSQVVCIWKDGNKTVNVSFDANKVVGKSKSGF